MSTISPSVIFAAAIFLSLTGCSRESDQNESCSEAQISKIRSSSIGDLAAKKNDNLSFQILNCKEYKLDIIFNNSEIKEHPIIFKKGYIFTLFLEEGSLNPSEAEIYPGLESVKFSDGRYGRISANAIRSSKRGRRIYSGMFKVNYSNNVIASAIIQVDSEKKSDFISSIDYIIRSLDRKFIDQ